MIEPASGGGYITSSDGDISSRLLVLDRVPG